MKILNKDKFERCETCVLGKMDNFRNRKPDSRAKNTLDLIHLDIAEPIKPIARGNFEYGLICVDNYSSLINVY